MFQNRIIPQFRSLIRRADGNVATLFAVAAMPMMLFAGAAMDYAGSTETKAKLQSAADAVALALVREPHTSTPEQLQAVAERQFSAMMRRDMAFDTTISVTKEAKTIRVNASVKMPTSFLRLVQQNELTVGATSVAAFGQPKIQIALVLDNTGSMGQMGKMDALKQATNDLLDKLQGMNANPGDIKVSLVPFNTQVRVDAANRNAPWLRWGVKLENPNISSGVAAAPTQAAWTGCISDRNQDCDISGEPPSGGLSGYVAANCQYGSLAQTMPLTANPGAIRSVVNSMTPTGATNVTIGFVTGLATLRADSPLGDASSGDPEVQKFVILLTDGNNTQNRFGGTGSEGNSYVWDIDNRLNLACAKARSSRVQVFTVRVIAGNEPLLQSCATDTGMYYSANSAAGIAPAFAKILDQIVMPRLTM